MTNLNDKLRAALKSAFLANGSSGPKYDAALLAEAINEIIATPAPQAAPSAEKLRQAYLNGLLIAAQVCDAKLKERAETGHAREASTARALAEEIRGFAADAPVPLTQAADQSAPTDLSKMLREHDDPRLYHEADVLMAKAADEIERYYGGMMAWKKTAEAKDAAPLPAQQASESADPWEFIADVSKQKPEKPDYWSSCGQCDNNIERARDLIDERAAMGDARKGGAGHG